MLTIGEFSNVCKVSAKTLRYYAEIGLLLPDKIDPDNGYRYYSIEQLETMLFINRLKSYNFSLEEIKAILQSEDSQDAKLYLALERKKLEIRKQAEEYTRTLDQLDNDLSCLKQGKSIMSYLDGIDVSLVDVSLMYLLSIRKMVRECDFAKEYGNCYTKIFHKIADEKLTVQAPPMVLFHSAEFGSDGLDTEFAVPVKEYATGTKDFSPGLCLKTILTGPYSGLPSVYTRQREWAEREGYESNGALYEVYITDPSEVTHESELITEVYYPVKKSSSLKR